MAKDGRSMRKLPLNILELQLIGCLTYASLHCIFLPTAGYKCYRIYSLSTVKKVKTMVQYPGWTPKIACDPQVVSPIPSFLPQEFLLCDVACDGFNHGPAKLQRSWAANRFTRPQRISTSSHQHPDPPDDKSGLDHNSKGWKKT